LQHINFFSHEWFSDRLIIFNEGYSMVHRFTIGGILGDEKNLIVDTGLGMTGDFKRYVDTCIGTEKPTACVCTNGYFDHVGSACLFEERYINSQDLQDPRIAPYAFNRNARFEALVDYALESKVAMNYCENQMIRDNKTEFMNIEDGAILDLGGVQVHILGLPGVTPGSVAVFEPRENYVFTGDAINTDVHLEHLTRDEIEAYAQTLRAFLTKVPADVKIYPMHLPLEMDIHVVEHLIQACEDIAEGKIQGDPPGETIFHLHQGNRNLRAHWVHGACIVYDRSKVEE